MNIAIIFAGGTGKRLDANSSSLPKQFLEVEGKPIIVHTLTAFHSHPEIDRIYISILADYFDTMTDLVKRYSITKVAGIVRGGETGLDSIHNALLAARKENPGDSVVLIHDGVRPIITPDVISRNIESVKKYGSAITCTPCYETIMVSRDGDTIDYTPLRKETFAGQAPQSFRLDDILAVHKVVRERPEKYKDFVDSCSMCHFLGKTMHLVPGNFGNIKVTVPEDLYILRAMIDYRKHFEKGAV